MSLQLLTNAYDSLLYILIAPLAGFFYFLHHILQALTLLSLLTPFSEHLATLVLFLLSAQDLLLSALLRFLQFFRQLLSAFEVMLESLKLFLELFQLLFLLELFKSSLLSLNLLLQELFLLSLSSFLLIPLLKALFPILGNHLLSFPNTIE